jgi:hypothetical protein
MSLAIPPFASANEDVRTATDFEFYGGAQNGFLRYSHAFYDFNLARGSLFLSATQFNARGRVWQFEYNGNGLSETPTRFFDGEEDESEYGLSVSWCDLTGSGVPQVAISAPGYDNDRGRVNYYTPTIAGFTLSQSWDGPEEGSRYGSSLRTARLGNESRDILLIGHPGTNSFLGGIDLIEANDQGEVPEQSMTFLVGIELGGEFGRFQHSFQFPGDGGEEQDCLAVDAPNATVNNNTGAGALRVYELGRNFDSDVTAELRATFTGTQQDQFLGCKIWYVMGVENYLLVGSEFDETDDENGNGIDFEQNVGWVGAYLHTANGFNTMTPSWQKYGARNEGFAFDVGAADWDGDGWGDIAVSSIFHNGQFGNLTGKIDVFFGSDTGFSDNPDCTIEGENPGGRLGASLSYGPFYIPGTDTIIGVAPLVTNNFQSEGAAFGYRFDPPSGFGCPPSGFAFKANDATQASMLPGPRLDRSAAGDLALLLIAVLVLYLVGRHGARRTRSQ